MTGRRDFLKLAAGAGVVASVPAVCHAGAQMQRRDVIAQAAAAPVLRRGLFESPVTLERIELVRNGSDYFVRVWEAGGAEGVAVAHSLKMALFYPIFLRSIAPGFIGTDARDLEATSAAVYVRESNYKMQGQAFWVCMASLEFAILDLLGKIAGRPVGALVGEIVRTSVSVYQASNRRGNPPEDEVERMTESLASTGARAAKIRLGGRMSNNADSLPGRTERLIPLLRKALGDGVTLYGDANGSYDVPNSVRIGRLMEDNGYAFLEEPCPFDHYEETGEVARRLSIPVAGGECEASLRQFRWMIEQDIVQVVQPDLFYFGGFLRSIRVARLAEAAGIPCTVHISGGDLGYVYMLHFASCVPNAGPHQEFKRETRIPLTAPDVLKAVGGVLNIPSGPGLGVTVDPAYLRGAQVVGV